MNKIKVLMLNLLFLAGTAANAQTQAVSQELLVENKVAILPVAYAGDGNDVKIEEMRYRLQNMAHDYLRSEAMELKFQDPAETNALLLKKGINETNFREYTPSELAQLLKVEYVLFGIVSQEYTGQATVHHTERREFERRGKERRHTTGISNTRDQLATNIDLDIYNDKGENIYSKSRRSILTGVDAYKNGIHYLLKRSPLYKK